MPQRYQSIARRLTFMNLLVSGIALLIAGVAFAAYDLATFRAATVRALSTEARMVASNSVTALLFNDPDTAAHTLAALRASPDVVVAQIYAADGHLFASYSRDGSAHPPALPRLATGSDEHSAMSTSSIDLARRIVSEGATIGTVRIQADLQAMYSRLARYALIVAGVLILSLAGALFVSYLAQGAISHPLAAVAESARQVSQAKDYSVRAPRIGTAYELAVLVDSFNEMLTEIQARDQSLRDAHDQLEARVRERTNELRAINSELEAFTYSVSHDLRAPLRHITGFASLLDQHAGASLDEQGRRYLTTISGAATRMATLIDDLLAFSRMGRATLTKQRVDLSQLVREARDEVSPDGNGRRITWNVQELPAVDADPALLRPVLVNLLSNALKYTSTRDETRIEIGAEPHPNEVVVFVRDNGVGFDMAYAPKVFVPFERLHAREFKGTGIGLANVKRIVERHGGDIWVESVPGKVTTFQFHFGDGATAP
jgi:signal transduction histidine kinase